MVIAEFASKQAAGLAASVADRDYNNSIALMMSVTVNVM
jgi:hypothetical protein